MPDIYDTSIIAKLPYSDEAEQSVLGAAIIDQAIIPTLLKYITPESFYKEKHKDLFRGITQMVNAGKTVDFITVMEMAVEKQIFDTPEDAKTYLATLCQLVPTTAHAEDYAKIVREKYMTRRLAELAESIMGQISDGTADPQTLLESSEQKLYELAQVGGLQGEERGIRHINNAVLGAYDRLQKISGEDRDKYIGLKTGFSDVDRVVGGLNKTDLIVIAGRPGMGKTSFVLNIAQNVARTSKKAVVIFSLEMSDEQLAMRLMSAHARVPSEKMRDGKMDGAQWVDLSKAAQVLSDSTLYVDDTACITVGEMKSSLRRVKNLGLVVIDYLQLMSTGNKSFSNRVQEVSEITRALKVMAKELDVPVIVCSQLSRDTDKRTDHRPVLADLRESGSIEQDADVVIFLYREGYYKDDADKNIAECIVAKNRHGEVDRIKLHWDGQHTQFSTLEVYADEN